MQLSDFEKEIIKFIEAHFTGCIAIIGVGSFFNNRYVKNSDIDVIIFDEVINSSYSEKIIVKDVIYELVVISASKIDIILKEDLIFNTGTITNALKYSKILKDSSSIAIEVIKYSETLRDKLYPTYDDTLIKNKCIILSNLIDDLEASTVFLDTYFIVNEINNITLDLLFNSEKAFKGFGKNISRVLESIAPNFYADLTKSTKLCLLENNKDLLIKNTKVFLNKYEGHFSEHSYRDVKMNLNKEVETLLIKIPIKLIHRNKIFVQLNTLKLALSKIGYELYFYQLYNDHVEIEIRGARKISIKQLYVAICKAMYIKPKHINKIKVVNLNASNFHSSFFNKISNLALYDIYFINISEAERLKVMHSIFSLIINKQPLNTNENALFTKYLTDKWSAAGYDSYLKFDYKSLLDYKKNWEKELENFRNKLNLEDVILSEVSKQMLDKFSVYLHEEIKLEDDSVTNFEINMLPKKIATKKIVALEKFLSKTLLIFNFENKKAFLPFILQSN